MLGTKQVYLLFIMLFTSCMSGLYLIGMVKDIGVQLVGLSAATAANAVAMVAIFNTLGRIILGPLSDKIGRLKIVTGTFVVMASSVLVLSFVDLNYGIYFVCVASVAFCFGGNITIFPAIVGDFFGMKTIVRITELCIKDLIRSACRFLYRRLLGGFKPTFMVIGVLCVVSFIIAILIQAPKQKKEQEEEYRSVA